MKSAGLLHLPLLALALLAGCAVGPDYRRPAAAAVPSAYAGDTGAWKVAQPRAGIPKGEWWKVFGDPRLDALEIQAAESNQQLAVALQQFAEARALLDVTRAGFFPNLDVAGSAIRQRTSPNSPLETTGQPLGAANTYNNFEVPLDLSYELDVWGRVRRSVESARAQAQASADDLETVLLAIQAEVATDYFSLRALDSEQAVLRSSVAVFRASRDLTRNRRLGGVAIDLEVAQAETLLRTTRAQLPAVELQRAQYEHALAVLTGQVASGFRIPEAGLAGEPPAIPPGLPSDLLERRPDISAAERRMAAANADIGVAQAAFFPTFDLIGLAGFDSLDSGSLLRRSSGLWAVGPAVTVPLFEGGRLKAGLRYSQAKYQEIVAAYRGVVLTAYAEVEDSLAAQNLLALQFTDEEAALLSARQQLAQANIRYRDGLVTYLEVATAESSELNVEFTVAQIRGQQLIAAVDLVKALGGGWQDRQP
jgi:multidrug efflux system outer membrane protein